MGGARGQIAENKHCGDHPGQRKQGEEEDRVAIHLHDAVDVLYSGRQRRGQGHQRRQHYQQRTAEGHRFRAQPGHQHQQRDDAARQHEEWQQRLRLQGGHGSTPKLAMVAADMSSSGCG